MNFLKKYYESQKNEILFIYKKICYSFILCIFLFSCEDVIKVDVPVAEPRLVIEATIDWFKETTGKNQFIKLTLTTPYFQNEVPPAIGAVVTITDSNTNTYNFVEENIPGFYVNREFNPQINQTYSLVINYNDEIYTATEVLKSVSSIDFVDQNNEGGFSGDEIEIKAFFTDPVNEENFYMYKFRNNTSLTASDIEVYKDEFIDGNQNFAYYSNENIKAGDAITITTHGVSKQFYNYLFKLQEQVGDNGGGPFETQPATVRGNCINLTNPENFPFGYFRLSEVDELEYIVK